MTQTICDFCGRVLGKSSILLKPVAMYNLSISRYGVKMDICEECFDSFKQWAASRKERGNDVDEDKAGNEQESRILDSEA